MKEVLDSRFLIEHYYSEDEEARRKTSRKMRDLIQTNEGLIPTIVISEIIQIVYTKEGKQQAETTYLSILTSGLRIQDLTSSIAKEAGILKSKYRNTPLGDCVIAATAIANHARILSDDPHFDNIKEANRTWI